MMKTKQAEERAAAQVAPGQPQDWPLACICNLCQCGNHRCSNFSWDEERAARLARSLDQRELDQQSTASGAEMDASGTCRAHGGCNYYRLNERYLTREPQANGHAESSSGAALAAAAADGGRKRPVAGAAAGRPKHSCNEEMLHVLVTRPEIAGRPRDNIVFEGDMDLKSTFETSYNALARMRLEHWKRHQEARNARATAQQQDVHVHVNEYEQELEREVSVVEGGGRRQGSMNRSMRAATLPATPDQTEDASEQAAMGHGGHRHQHRHQRSRASSDKHARHRRQAAGPPPSSKLPHERQLLDEPELQLAAVEQEFDDVFLLADGENYLQDTPKRHRSKQVPTARGDSQRQREQQMEQQMEQFANQQATNRTSRPGRVAHSPPPPAQPHSPSKQLVKASPLLRVRSPTPADAVSQRAAAAPRMDQSTANTEQQCQQQALAPESRRTAAGMPSRYSIRQQEESSKINDRNDPIDPDLAPIICYDSNMNRLERVGLRKRSKYRPSTSLRPGGRGFFGGCGAEMSAELEAARADGQQRAKDKTKTTEQARGTPDGRATSTSPTGAAGATTKELDRGNDLNLSGRRHLLNHMGRVDHIKEAELEEQRKRRFEDKSTLTEELLARESLDKQLVQQAEALTLAAAVASDQQVELERRLAEEEESAAVAEIQRCTKEPVELQAQQPTTPEPQASSLSNLVGAHQMVADERSRTSSRQSRQQRVCQDQSFSICENEYPEARGAFDDDYCIKIGGRASSSSRASQREQNSGSPFNLAAARAEKAKNLFRESPDFILTTGHARQQQQASNKLTNGPAKSSENGVENHLMEGRSSQMSAISENEAETMGVPSKDKTTFANGSSAIRLPCSPSCRVLNLDNQYEFVGSRLGHKYFVERDLATREPALISETA